MTAISDIIAGALRQVPGLIGATWFKRARQTGPMEQVRPRHDVWSSSFSAAFNDQGTVISEDSTTRVVLRRTAALLQVADTVTLAEGDQVSPDKATIYTIVRRHPSGPGTIVWEIGSHGALEAEGGHGATP
jgi:hypothetical protein